MKKSFVILLSVILIATVLFGCAEKTHTTSDTRDESSSAVQNDKEKTESDSKTKENKNDNNGKADTTKKTGNVAEMRNQQLMQKQKLHRVINRRTQTWNTQRLNLQWKTVANS